MAKFVAKQWLAGSSGVGYGVKEVVHDWVGWEEGWIRGSVWNF